MFNAIVLASGYLLLDKYFFLKSYVGRGRARNHGGYGSSLQWVRQEKVDTFSQQLLSASQILGFMQGCGEKVVHNINR